MKIRDASWIRIRNEVLVVEEASAFSTVASLGGGIRRANTRKGEHVIDNSILHFTIKGSADDVYLCGYSVPPAFQVGRPLTYAPFQLGSPYTQQTTYLLPPTLYFKIN